MKGDLHVHSYLSDGSNSPEWLFQLAGQEGLGCLAITDHDCLPDPERDVELSRTYGVMAIHGTEMSLYDTKRKRRVHILCYLPDDMEPLRKLCNSISSERMSVGLEMAALVAEKYPVTVEDIRAVAKMSTSLFKQHIMLTLMHAGYSTELYGSLWQELFDNKTGTCCRKGTYPDVYEVLPQIRKAGGISVMAHPYTYRSTELLEELIEQKLLDGIEVWSSKSTVEQETHLLQLAERNGLIPTGGSDFHGATASRVSPLGCAFTPQASIEALLALKKARSSLRETGTR